MPKKIAWLVAAAILLMVLAYFFYVGCRTSEWRSSFIERGPCRA